MKDLKSDLKLRKFKNVYLFYGPEKFLTRHYENQMKEAVCGGDDMNLDIFEGKGQSVGQVADAAETLPFMGDYRLVIFRDSCLFISGRKEESEKMTAFLNDIPENTILLFVEEDVDKRGRLFKKTVEAGRAVEFKTPGERELVNWLSGIFKRSGKTISEKDAFLLLSMVGCNMDALYKEADKLIDYKGCGQAVMTEDIERICTKSLEAKVFDLVDAVGYGRLSAALSMYANLLIMKEQPVMVLAMLARQFRLLLQSKLLAVGGVSSAEIAAALGTRTFVISKCLKQGENFTEDKLVRAVQACLETDLKIKTGKMGDKLAVELLIIEYTA